nr:AEC family transporter [Nakamurella deserti]
MISGFAVIAVVVGVGYLLGRWTVLGASGREVLSLLTFNVATPALLFALTSASDLAVLLSQPLLVTVLATLVCAGVFVVVGALRRWGVGRTTIGALSASYVNAGNLGIPIASYVLGDASLMVPVILFQMVLYTPVALTVIDLAQGAGGVPAWRRVATPLRNPVVVAALAGIVVSVTGLTLWHPLGDAVDLIAGMAVPAMLLAYGISLRGASTPGRGEDSAMVWLAVALKTVLQPVLAWVLAALVFGLEGPTLLAVVVIAALPAAQNIFTHASRYRVGVDQAREVILLTTLLAPVALTVVAALLG